MSKGDICPDGGRCPGVFVRGQMFVIVIIIMYNSNSNVFKNGIDRNISDCVASPARKPTGEAKGSADQSMKKPILVSLILFNHPLKALMLEASTTLWSS